MIGQDIESRICTDNDITAGTKIPQQPSPPEPQTPDSIRDAILTRDSILRPYVMQPVSPLNPG